MCVGLIQSVEGLRKKPNLPWRLCQQTPFGLELQHHLFSRSSLVAQPADCELANLSNCVSQSPKVLVERQTDRCIYAGIHTHAFVCVVFLWGTLQTQCSSGMRWY